MKLKFMREAVRLAIANVKQGRGGPFGAVVVREGLVVGRGVNRVTSANDPTAHAEIVAIREACGKLGVFHLADCELYTTCEPCPMCLGAAYWARVRRIYHASSRADAAAAGFADEWIYEEFSRPPAARRVPLRRLGRAEGRKVFAAWNRQAGRIEY